jgi:hypothetical protein
VNFPIWNYARSVIDGERIGGTKENDASSRLVVSGMVLVLLVGSSWRLYGAVLCRKSVQVVMGFRHIWVREQGHKTFLRVFIWLIENSNFPGCKLQLKLLRFLADFDRFLTDFDWISTDFEGSWKVPDFYTLKHYRRKKQVLYRSDIHFDNYTN